MGWLGLGQPNNDAKPKSVFCVLSGGGSRASFQIGALDYLYHHDDQFRPTGFVGTSAGAVISVALAQYAEIPKQHQALSRLRDIWLAMSDQEDMFTGRTWLNRIMADFPDWRSWISQPEPTPPTPSRRRLPFARSSETVVAETPAAGPLEQALQPDEEVRPQWSLDLLAQLASNVGRLPKLSGDLAAAWRGLDKSRSLYRPGRVLSQLLDEEFFHGDRIAASGVTLRLAMVALESGEVHYLTESGKLVNRDQQEIDPGPYEISLGVLASCAIPGVFRPVPIGAETYIDGGARETVPAETAIGQLGADRAYVISSQHIGVPERSSMAGADIFSTVTRATEILMDEAARDELAYAYSAGALVIAPEFAVHDAMTVDPGLSKINYDYGWLVAAEQHLKLDQASRDLHKQLIKMRMRCLELEKVSLAEPASIATEELAGAKRQLRGLLNQVGAGVLPPGGERWWANYEVHRQQPTRRPSWLS